METHENMPEMPDKRTLLMRGLSRHCPQCGRGKIFSGWIKVRERCDACGLKLLANEGDLWAYIIFLDRALFLFPLVVMIYLRINKPDSPWTWLIPAALATVFVVTMPHRNGVSLACDYFIRRTCGDLADDANSGVTHSTKNATDR
jgi:uncharacterized protein (DUF983 family)